MREQLRAALCVFIALTVVTGVIYPALVTVLAQLAFPHQANGSIIVHAGKPAGSELIGQPFASARYFWSRPSATSPPYNGGSSTGSNLGPTNPAQLAAIKKRIANLRAAHVNQVGPIPIDLVTASASGLDPHISPAAAEYQAQRVAQSRGLTIEEVRALISQHTELRTFGVLGEPRVNVLLLNLALDDTVK